MSASPTGPNLDENTTHAYGRIDHLDLKATVADQSIVEIETFGVPDEALDRLRGVRGVTSVGVETRDQAQVVLVQSAVGAELVPDLLRALDGATVGRVVAREPTLEDAYVELVRSA
jgi:ABC-2 type transport system ATP-binding protein